MTNSPSLEVGTRLKLRIDQRGRYIGGYSSAATIPADTEVEVRKVGTASVWVRGEATIYGYPQEVTLPVYFNPQNSEQFESIFETLDPNAPRPRQIGEAPEGGISIDDPRIAWIWEDAAKVATKARHCAEYDRLCDELGAPGRERNFTVKRTVNGFEVSKKFKATSKKHAERMFDAELPSVVTTDLYEVSP